MMIIIFGDNVTYENSTRAVDDQKQIKKICAYSVWELILRLLQLLVNWFARAHAVTWLAIPNSTEYSLTPSMSMFR